MRYLYKRLDCKSRNKVVKCIMKYCVMMTGLRVETVVRYTCSEPHTSQLV